MISPTTIPTPPATTLRALRDEFRSFFTLARTPRVRPLTQWATEELVIPEGPFEGRRWRPHRQPYARHIFAEMERPRWNRFVNYGCVQSGKSLHAWVTPAVYHLFERRESVIAFVPTMDISRDKWEQEIKPVILRSRYADELPDRGRGSRGGSFESITFKHGPTLKFMSGKGGDEKRSSFTCRVVLGTEVDKSDESAESSEESDPVSQVEARTEAYGDDKFVGLECTVSTKSGRIHREWEGGSAGEILCPCPHCDEHVLPEREHLVGWETADNEVEAGEQASFYCPGCGAALSEAERIEMNQRSLLVHRGQHVERDADGTPRVVGELPKTYTCGIRWNAFHNLFWTTAHIARGEWRAKYNAGGDEEDTEKYRIQFVWARPYQPPEWDAIELDARVIQTRMAAQRERGQVPAGYETILSMGVDLGKRLLHWITPAWSADGSPHVVDYGRIDVASDDLGEERALKIALRDLRDMVLEGFQSPSGRILPRHVLIDARYQGDIVFAFARECQQTHDRLFLPAMGLGRGKQYVGPYKAPKEAKGDVVLLRPGYHVAWRPDKQCFVVMVDADHWKTFLHRRLATPLGKPGALTLYDSRDPREHVSLSKHFTSEKQKIEFIPDIGEVVTFLRQSRNNHWLDSAYNACVAADLAGMRVLEEPVPRRPATPPPARSPLTTPDGRPFLITER